MLFWAILNVISLQGLHRVFVILFPCNLFKRPFCLVYFLSMSYYRIVLPYLRPIVVKSSCILFLLVGKIFLRYFVKSYLTWIPWIATIYLKSFFGGGNIFWLISSSCVDRFVSHFVLVFHPTLSLIFPFLVSSDVVNISLSVYLVSLPTWFCISLWVL